MNHCVRLACLFACAVLCAVVPGSADEPATRITLPKSAAGMLADAGRVAEGSGFDGDPRTVLGVPAPTPDASAYVPDAAFDRFVDPLAVGRAWDTLDSGALIDSALALMEGERVLLRPHRSLSTKEIVTTAARLAVERRDEASLARLEKAAATHQRDDLTQAVAAARSVGAAGKAASVPVEIGTVSPEEYRVCKDVSHAALRARLTGNVRYIAPIVTAKGDVVVPGAVPTTVSQPLRQQVVSLCNALPEKPIVNSAPLDMLARVARQDRDEYHSERQRKQEELFQRRREEEARRREGERRRREEEQERRDREGWARDPIVVTGGY